MKFLTATVLMGTVGLATAVPSNSGPKNIVADFDDLKALSPVPALNKIPKPYKGLCYDNFILSDNTLSTFVAPKSPPNTAASDVTTRLEGNPVLTTNTCSSGTKSFDAYEFFVGCAVIAANNVASAPTICNYRATGTTKEGKIVKKDFKYVPDKLVKPPMKKFALDNKFKNLVKLEVSLPDPAENAANVILTDSYSYSIKT